MRRTMAGAGSRTAPRGSPHPRTRGGRTDTGPAPEEPCPMSTTSSPNLKRAGLAARAGHWSATHRKTAIFGWLAFVLVAVVLGGAVGTQNQTDADTDIGESG